MSVLIILIIAVLIFLPAVRHRRLHPRSAHQPLEPGRQPPALPRTDASASPPRGSERSPAVDPEQALMDDYAEGRLSVEEYERRLDALYRRGMDEG